MSSQVKARLTEREQEEVLWRPEDVQQDRVLSGEADQRRLARTRLRPEWVAPGLLFLFDTLSWVAIYGITGWLRGDVFYSTPLGLFLVELLQVAVIVQALFIIGGYNRQTDMRSLTYTTEHILAVAGAALFISFLIYSAATFDQSMHPSRGVLLVSFLVFLPISIFYRRWIRIFVARNSATKAFLVIGGGEAAVQFYHAYKASPNRQRLEFVNLERERIGQPIAGRGSPLLEGDFATKLENLNERYSGVILAEAPGRLKPELLERLVRTQFQRTRVYTLESFYETHWRYVPLDAIDPVWPLQTGFQLARMSPYHYLKRLCDIVIATLALIATAPLFALIALSIWMKNGRPFIFTQSRVGRDDAAFTVYKFRTMAEATDQHAEDLYTRVGDPRITRLGRALRKFRLDELPQLWNVLRGEMSLIGPRAEWTKCVERYEKNIPFYHFRHLVKPGITGWAQVNYPYGESEEDALEKLKYDLYYIRHYSLKLDAMIILKTIHTMLFSKGR
jgi:exopolysaccharide biosynthesis polyprenyl glycosylphosphotransferase